MGFGKVWLSQVRCGTVRFLFIKYNKGEINERYITENTKPKSWFIE